MQKQKRITLNSDKRKTIADVFQNHWEREDSPVMKKYDEAKKYYNDMRSQMKENNNCELRCMQILRDATGYSLSDVRKKFNNPSDQYFTAKQLVDLKVADHIL